MRKEYNRYVDCFFLRRSIDMGATRFCCKIRKITDIDKCPENCPYFMTDKNALEALKKILEAKKG